MVKNYLTILEIFKRNESNCADTEIYNKNNEQMAEKTKKNY